MENLAPAKHRDSLSAVLRALRFQRRVFCRSTLSAPWGFAVEKREVATFHCVVSGRVRKSLLEALATELPVARLLPLPTSSSAPSPTVTVSN
jgi:hypothetical protein